MSAAPAPSRRPRLGLGLLLAACAALTTASAQAGHAPTTPAPAGKLVAALEDQGVAVTFRWTSDGASGHALVATFSPDAGFHLYSADLPDDGVEGVGRPTRVELDGSLVAVGPLVVDQVAVETQLDGVDQPVPVYPAGPVTLRLPARASLGQGGAAPALAWVSYAACSATACLPPVTHRRVVLAIPARS